MNHSSHPKDKTSLETIKRAPPDPQEGAVHGRDPADRLPRRFSALGPAIAARRAATVIAWAKTSGAQLTALAAGPIPDTTGREAGVEFDAGMITHAIRMVYYQVSTGNLRPQGSSSALEGPTP
jgi:hypothetical protein